MADLKMQNTILEEFFNRILCKKGQDLTIGLHDFKSFGVEPLAHLLMKGHKVVLLGHQVESSKYQSFEGSDRIFAQDLTVPKCDIVFSVGLIERVNPQQVTNHLLTIGEEVVFICPDLNSLTTQGGFLERMLRKLAVVHNIIFYGPLEKHAGSHNPSDYDNMEELRFFFERIEAIRVSVQGFDVRVEDVFLNHVCKQINDIVERRSLPETFPVLEFYGEWSAKIYLAHFSLV